MRIWRSSLAFALILLLWAGSAFAQPRAYIPSINDGTVTVMDVSDNSIIDVINTGDRPISTAVTPDGTKVYVPRNGPGRVVVIETSTNTVLTTLNVGGSPSDVAITPDGSFAYVSDFNNRVLVIDTATDMVVDTIPFNNTLTPGAILVTPDGAYAYVLITGSNQSLHRIDTATNMIEGPALSGFGNGLSMDVTPDGSKIYIASRNSVNSTDTDGVQVINIAMDGTPSVGPFIVFEIGTECISQPQDIAV
ncbi:MAG: YncE family protein, partial [Thermodesulfobacteriota bacterium]